MSHVKAQAAILADWVTLHPLFTVGGAVALVLILRFVIRRWPRRPA